MPEPHVLLLIVAGAMIGGLINRLRGWGTDGWAGTGKPVWLTWVQKILFNRAVLAISMGALICGFSLLIGRPHLICYYLGLSTPIMWFFGIVWPWGDYLDGTVIPNINHGIKWVDSFVEKILQPWLLTTRWAALASDADFIDSFSFGLRDVYYIPLFTTLWVLAGWWVFLPIGFFWQDAIVYHVARKYVKGDFAVVAEPVGGFIRVGLMLTAIALG